MHTIQERESDLNTSWPEQRRALLGRGDARRSFKRLKEANLRDVLGEQEPALPIRAFTLGEFLHEPIPAREAIIAPWLFEQSIGMVHSWRGVGKTLLLLTLSYSVAAGRDFLGWKIEKPRKVLYIDGEMPARTMQDRLRGIRRADKGRANFDDSYLRIITPDYIDGPVPNLATAEGQEVIAPYIKDAQLIIVDNIACLVRSDRGENEAESWREAGTWALELRRQRRSVLFAHHEGKSKTQRGASSKEDTLDAVVQLKHPSDYLPEQGARFEVHFKKVRGAPDAELRALEVQAEELGGGRIKWTTKLLDDSTYDRVVALANDGLTQVQIARELELTRATVCYHYKRGAADGKIKGVKAR